MSKALALAALDEARRDLDAVLVVVDEIAGDLAVAHAQVTLLPDDPPALAPTIANARVEPASLPYGGGRVTVSADVAHATTVRLNGSVIGLPWSMDVSATRTLTLTAGGPGGTASVDLLVTVALDEAPVIARKAVNLARCIVAPNYYGGSRYERHQQITLLRGARARLRAWFVSIESGGAPLSYGASTTLHLTFNSTRVASTPVTPTSAEAWFDVDLSQIAEGWYRADIEGASADWSTLPAAVYVLQGVTASPQTRMPALTASYELSHPPRNHPVEHRQAWVPCRYVPTAQPWAMRDREFPAFSEAPNIADLHITYPVVQRGQDDYRPNLSAEGVWSTFNRQDYFWFDLEAPIPRVQLLDGPRGVGNLTWPTHLEIGSAAPVETGPVENIYFCDPWRVGKVRGRNCEVVTLAGYRHRAPPSYWDGPQDLELLGDWSAVPAARRGFRGLWGMAWDSRTFATDESAAPIPAEANLRPHLTGVVMFVADARADRVCKLEFDPRSHATPPRVTELIVGLSNCWDCVEVAPGVLAVSDRMAHRVLYVDMTSGAILDQFAARQPEGLAFQDGWLYYASVASRTIRKREVASGRDEQIVDMAWTIDNNSRWTKIALSDGTFGPRGMIACMTWSNNYYGNPRLWAPDGTYIHWIRPRGGGPELQTGTYGASVAIGQGRMVFASALEGLVMASRRLPGDAARGAEYEAGHAQWYGRGLHMVHGDGGFGYYGYPLPWGLSPEIDAYLLGNGHTRS